MPRRRSSSRQLRVCALGARYHLGAHAVPGRWPEKSVKVILRLLKNAESNADAKGIELEDIVIKNIVVQQAPVRQP